MWPKSAHRHCFLSIPFCRLVKDTSQWNNASEGLAAEKANYDQITASLEELDEEKLNRQVQEATAKRDAASADLERCGGITIQCYSAYQISKFFVSRMYMFKSCAGLWLMWRQRRTSWLELRLVTAVMPQTGACRNACPQRRTPR